MPATPNHALPYPALSAAANVPADLQALAEATEAALDVDTGDVVDTGVAAETGWSLNTSTYRVLFGKIMFLFISLSRTGADITGGSGSNITDQAVCHLTDVSLKSSTQVPGLFRGGPTSGACWLTGATVFIFDIHSGSTIATGQSAYFYFTYPILGTAT